MNSFNFKSWLTFLGRNKGYTLINLIGFSISLMFVILLGLYLQNELTVDRFHEKGDRLYRLATDDGLNWAAPVITDLQSRYPEIESFTRIDGEETVLETEAGKSKINALMVDSAFFTMFTFPLLEGIPENQLQTTHEVTLSESFARKLFGSESALGQTLKLDGEEFIVTGVARDFERTHFVNPDVVVRFDQYLKPYMDRYGNASYFAYVLIRENANFHDKLEDAAEYLKGYYWLFKNGIFNEVRLETPAEWYYNPKTWGTAFRSNNKRFLWILGTTALVVLLFAVINYINLSAAQSGFRAREAATRRLLGGTRNGLFFSYMTESVLFCAGAFLTAFILALAAESVFNRILETNIAVRELLTPVPILVSLAGIVVLGVVSGIFPALIITRFKPIDVVKGEFTRKTKMTYSRLFIGFQFCITIVLIGCTITILRQTHFLRHTPLGFDKEQLIYLENTLSRERLPGLRDRLTQIPGVAIVSFVAGSPIDGGNNQTVTYDDGKTISFQVFEVDSCFFPMLGLEIVRETGIRADSAVWINEAAARELNLLEEGDMFKLYEHEAVAGIVKDFNFRNLKREIAPLVIRVLPLNSNHKRYGGDVWSILVKIDSSDPVETYRQVRAAYSEYNGGEPFDSGFADQTIAGWYDEQERTAAIIGYFSLLAILISALGLFAMTTYFMRQRALDVAVRKVFGATSREVLERLISGFLRIVAVSFVLAVPVIWYIMSRWLRDYAYHIPLRWTIFALAGLLVFGIALAAIFRQIYRTASANPVKSLKNQ